MNQPLAPIEPLEMLGDLLGSLIDGRTPYATTNQWFRTGVVRALRDDLPLEQALGLVSPDGGRGGTLARQARMLQRDEHLRHALRLVAIDDEVSTWRRCVRLAEEIERFQRADWPAYRHRDCPPDHWTPLRWALWSALRVGLGVPISPEGLHRIAKQTPGCFESGACLKVLTQYL
jgi:hypothetical protein